MKRCIATLLFLSGGLCALIATAKPALRVAYAGSMGTVLDRALGPAFAARDKVAYQGIGRGSYGLAQLIASHRLRADVFISVTPGPAQLLLGKHLLRRALPVASTEMVIAYSPRSRFVGAFKAAAADKKPWYSILEQPGVRFGRTDPRTDPQGRNIIFTMQLAARYYHQPRLVKKVLGDYRNPRQIFSESSLLSRLESGQIDASSGYLSAVKSRHLPYIHLPSQINLSDPRYMHNWYRKAGFKLTRLNGKTERLEPAPLIFYAGVLTNAKHSRLARRFIEFLKSPSGRAILRKDGYSNPHGSPLQ